MKDDCIVSTKLEGGSERERETAIKILLLDQAGRTILPGNIPEPSAQSLICNSENDMREATVRGKCETK